MSKKITGLIDPGECRPLNKRKIRQDTCELFRYTVAEIKGKVVQVAPYNDQEGNTVAQHIRTADKEFPWYGESKGVQLFGQHLWRTKGRRVVVTEGEIDAMSLSQVQGNKWPVVSLPNGVSRAKKDMQNNLEWLMGFEEVVLCFDMDDPGKQAVEDVSSLFGPNQLKVMHLPLKDANEMLKAGRESELIDAMWGAKEYRPDGLVSIDTIMEEAEKPVELGLPWFLDSVTKLTYGRRHGEIYGFGAGTGVGKTDFLTQQMAYDVTELDQHIGVVFLEQRPLETAKRIASKLAGKRFYVPDDGWTQEELKESLLKLQNKITFYDSWGECEWEVVKNKIRFMVLGLGIKLIYLDHLTAMADTSNEKESLEQIMKEMATTANELGCIIHFVSHLSTPEGKPHEEGGRVMIKNFKGSRSIGFWSFFMFGMERNTQAEDPEEQQRTTFRVLKDRYTGQATGKYIYLGYECKTGTLFETFVDDTKEAETFGF